MTIKGRKSILDEEEKIAEDNFVECFKDMSNALEFIFLLINDTDLPMDEKLKEINKALKFLMNKYWDNEN